MNRIFSGIQPTGELHIGNYIGAIKNWVKLLDKYDCIFSIVDYHAITVEQDVASFQETIFDAALVNVACGLEPGKCSLFVQSNVPEHTELAWIFNCITPIGDLSRMTQFKDKSTHNQKNINMGLMDYPVLQAADILLYKAGYVPVGEDQVQHIEFSRRIARKFNSRFGEIFPEPQPILSDTPRVLGLDGDNKMSKSLDNYIGILDEPDVVWEKLRPAKTDENRKRLSDPGDPMICNIHTMHLGFSGPDEIMEIERDCRTANIGCIDCKKTLCKNLVDELEPIRSRVHELRQKPDMVHNMLAESTKRCQKIAREVMGEVREAIGVRSSI
jgi:tryptophanyl-tRNA synthetase